MSNEFDSLWNEVQTKKSSPAQPVVSNDQFNALWDAVSSGKSLPQTTPQPAQSPYYDPSKYGYLPKAHGPVSYDEVNPIVGENLFLTNTFPIRQQDNPAIKTLKGVGNVATSIVAAPGEVYRKAILQGSSLLNSGKLSELPKNTSFTGDILPQGASTAIGDFKRRNPVLGGLAEMGLETIADPTSFISGKTIGNAAFRKNPIEELGANASFPATKPGTPPIPTKKYGPMKVATAEQKALSKLQEGMQTVQNRYGHSDILAPFPAGTTLDKAFQLVKAETGVDLPKLTSDLEKAMGNAKSVAEMYPAERARLARAAGVRPGPGEVKLQSPIPGNKADIPLESPMPKVKAESIPEQTITETIHPKAEAIVAKLDRAAEEARQRIASRKGRVMSGLPVDDIADYAVIGASKIAKGAVNYSVWAVDMAKEFGDEVKPHLQDIWNQAKSIHADFAKQAESFREKIDRTPKKGKSIGDMAKDLRTQFVDDVAPLERLEKGVTGSVASAEKSLYKQARLFRGSAERAHEMVKSRLQPIVKEVEKLGKSANDLGDYALAVHARDVNAKGVKSGFSDAEINAVIKQFGTPEMEAARQKMVQISTDLLQELADNGVIEQSLVKTLRDKYPNYMPLFRSFDDDKVEFSRGLSKALANVTSPIKKLKGSERDVVDPLESMVKNIFQTVSAVDRNKVALQLSRLADADDGTLIRRLTEGEEKGRLNAVYAMENGKKVYYEVQPDVYKSIMNLDRESSSLLIKILQKPASMLRAGATLTPEFGLRNPMRDVVQAFVVSKSGLNPFWDVPLALADIVKSKRGKETMFNQFLKDNGGFGNIVSMDRKVHQEAVASIVKQPFNPKGTFVNIMTAKPLLKMLRTMADISESATKLGEYKAAIRKGASRQEAAYRARDLMDFGRAGASIREANKVVAFLNANIQGKSKLIRAIRENPVRVTSKAVVGITLPTVGEFMAQKYLANDVQQKAIEDAPTWLKDSFWLIPIPGTNQVARIPKPFDLAPVFANLPKRWMDYVFNNDKQAFDEFAKSTLASYSIPVMLTGLTPIIEGMANYSFFRQGPIIPQREQDVEFPDQYDIRTTEAAKFIGKGVNKITGGEGAFKNFGSPRIVDNTIRGMTGGLGGYFTSFVDFVTEETGIVDKKQKPARKISETPLLRAFLVNETGTGKAMNDLYDEREVLTRKEGSANAKKSPFPDQSRLKELDSAAKKISDINKEMRKIENDPDTSSKAKRNILDELNAKRNEIARDAMKNKEPLFMRL